MEIEVQCPECGGSHLWQEEHRLNHCPYCGSLLFFEADTERRFFIEPRIRTRKEIKQALVFSKAEKARAEANARYRSVDDDKDYEMLSMMSKPIAPYVEEFNKKIHLGECRLIFAPYWQFQGLVFHSLLGKDQHETKSYSLRRIMVDETLAAYNEIRWSFRDRGLQLKKTILKKATRAFFSASAHIEFSSEAEPHLNRLMHASTPEDAGPTFLFRSSTLLQRHNLPLFRPYWVATYTSPQSETVLIDASYGTIAGILSATERAVFQDYKRTPYSSSNPPEVLVLSSRCPVCGADCRWNPLELIHFCKNCGRALIIEKSEVKNVPYSYSQAENGTNVFIPCWQFRVSLNHRARKFGSLADYFRMFFPARLMKDCKLADTISIPACALRTDRKGDEIFSALIATASEPSTLLEGPLKDAPVRGTVALDSDGANRILPVVIPSAAPVHPTLFKAATLTKILKETVVDTQGCRLTLHSFPVANHQIRVGRRTFPVQLLDQT